LCFQVEQLFQQRFPRFLMFLLLHVLLNPSFHFTDVFVIWLLRSGICAFLFRVVSPERSQRKDCLV